MTPYRIGNPEKREYKLWAGTGSNENYRNPTYDVKTYQMQGKNEAGKGALTWERRRAAVRRICERVAVCIATVLPGQTQRSWGLIVAVVMVELSCVEHLEAITSRRIPTRRYVGEDLLSKG